MYEWKKVGILWSPQKEGDEVSGKFLGCIASDGEFESNILIIQTDKEIANVYGSTVLDDKLKHGMVKEGDYIKIVFKGKQKSEKGKEYKDFEMYVSR